jgi:mitochondrial fission protein ELM1
VTFKVTQDRTWILNESVTLQSYAVAVAEAVGLPYDIKRVEFRGAFRFLPSWLQLHFAPLAALDGAPTSSLPRLIIAIGRRSVPLALALKTALQSDSFALYIRQSECQLDVVLSPPKATKRMAAFDAIYNVTMAPANIQSSPDGLISDIELLVSVIKDELGIANPKGSEQLQS